MTIFEYFRKKGIETADASFYRKIADWKNWYNSNVPRHSTYYVYTGKGEKVRRRRKSLGMAKMVCEDIADLLINERIEIVMSNEAAERYVINVLDENNFWVLGNDYQERMAYTGTIAFVPYLYDAETDGAGRMISGRIGIDYVSAGNIFPVSWNNDRITEVIFAFPKTVNRNKYIHLQHHRKNAEGLYVIENSVVERGTSGESWTDLTPEQWHELKPFETLVPLMETGSTEPQFVIQRLNITNNADEDESNPMGVAIFANAIDVLRSLDVKYDSYCNEFELGRKRIFVAPEMLRNNDGSPAFDPEDTVFYKLPDDYADKDQSTGMIHEVDLDLRVEQHSKALNDDLNYLSLKCGFGPHYYRFESGQVKTATEVVSENSKMFRRLNKHEIILEQVLIELCRIIIRLGNVVGAGINENVDIDIKFDDSIIEDKQAERSADRQDVAMGAMPLWQYRMKWYNEDEETAKQMVQMDEDVIE